MTPENPTAAPAVTPKKGSPWSHLGRGLTAQEWEALKTWRKLNPWLAFKWGETNAAGRFFHAYGRTSLNGEVWQTKESWNKSLKYSRNREKSPKILKRRRDVKRVRYHAEALFRDRVNFFSKRWKINNPEKFKAVTKKWYLKNRHTQRYLARARTKAKERRDKLAGNSTEKVITSRIALDAGVRAAPVASRSLIKRVYRHAALTGKQYGTKNHVDHIIPLEHGGFHVIGNLQILPEKINLSKGSNPFWMHEGCYLDWRNVPRHLWPEKLRPEYERLILLHPKPVHFVRVGFKGQPPVNQLIKQAVA